MKLVNELILQGKRFGGKEAVERGIINKLASKKVLEEVNPTNLFANIQGIEYAQNFAAKGKDRATYGGLKRSLHNSTYNLLLSDTAQNQSIVFSQSKL